MDALKTSFLSLFFFVAQFFGYTPSVENTTVVIATTTLTVATTTQPVVIQQASSTLKIFYDPEGRYKIVIPNTMDYEYDATNTGLYLWPKESPSQAVQFGIDFVSEEARKDMPILTKEEINRTLENGSIKIDVYDPFETYAGHEEAYIKLKSGGYIHFYNAFSNEKTQPILDLIIKNTEILK